MVQKTVSLLGLDDSLAYHEPYLLDSLDHANLAQIREAQWDPELLEVKAITFTMPFYEGGSLYSVLDAGNKLSVGQSIDLACQILGALTYLHSERQLLHRDVKPGNVFLSADLRTAYLGDLGSAAPMDDQGRVEARGGTMLYRPPEAVHDFYTSRGDVYALGLTMFEMVNGPFVYAEIDYDEVDRRLARGERALPSRLLRHSPHVPDALSRVINRMVDKDPSRRPASPAIVARDLRRISHLDWREVVTDDSHRSWLGLRRDARPGRPDREVSVVANVIERGPNTGAVELTSKWRPVGMNPWHGMPSLRRRVHLNDDAAWRDFFKSVETVLPHR